MEVTRALSLSPEAIFVLRLVPDIHIRSGVLISPWLGNGVEYTGEYYTI
jgi:hypothetical protein